MTAGVVCCVGDLVLDVVVGLREEVRAGADTDSSIVVRAGGSAANTAMSVVSAGGRSRLCARVGDDDVADLLERRLRAAGVETLLERGGVTGTVVALVDGRGERSMLTDRGAASHLSAPPEGWSSDLGALHIPAYSLLGGGPLAATARSMLGDAPPDVVTSVDASSTSLLGGGGAGRLVALLAELEVDVLFANADEAAVLGIDAERCLSGPIVQIAKRGPASALAWEGGQVTRCPTTDLGVHDSTGAGDAFAAGFLTARLDGASIVDAVGYGHGAARRLMLAR